MNRAHGIARFVVLASALHFSLPEGTASGQGCQKIEGLINTVRRTDMSVAKVTEIIASSPDSFESAVREGIERANQTLKNVRGAWVRGQKVMCNRDGGIEEYRVILKVSFVLTD
jgi:hypothetical protein